MIIFFCKVFSKSFRMGENEYLEITPLWVVKLFGYQKWSQKNDRVDLSWLNWCLLISLSAKLINAGEWTTLYLREKWIDSPSNSYSISFLLFYFIHLSLSFNFHLFSPTPSLLISPPSLLFFSHLSSFLRFFFLVHHVGWRIEFITFWFLDSF